MADNRKYTDESWGVVAAAANRAMDEDQMLLKQLKELRVEKGLSVEEVAWRCSRTEEDILEFEAHGANPTMSFIRRYALALGCFVTHELVYDFDDRLMEEEGDRMSAVCTCPEVDPVKRATKYTVLHMGLEPHAVTCPRHGHPIVEPAEAEVEAGEVFLVVRAPRSQVVKARRLLHSQDWYKGSDVVVDPEFADDYYGVPVGPLVASLRSYWGQWKAAAQHRKQARR